VETRKMSLVLPGLAPWQFNMNAAELSLKLPYLSRSFSDSSVSGTSLPVLLRSHDLVIWKFRNEEFENKRSWSISILIHEQ
jgi:hypothetical protein